MKSPRPVPVSTETVPSPLDPTAAGLVVLDLDQLDACVALDQQALGGLWTREQWRTELSDQRRPCLGWIQQGRLIGVACGWMVVDELHITAVAVAPTQRRQGLGRQLLEGLMQHALQLGAAHATLEVSASNQAAVGLYGSCGFQSAGVRRGYYRNGDDALIQWVRLQHADEVRIAAHS